MNSTKGEVPSEVDQEWMLCLLEEVYSCCKVDVTDFLGKDHFVSCLSRLNMKSSPGYPYSESSPTIGDFLQWDGFCYSEERMNRLWADVQSWIRGDLEVFWRTFIKDEPHTIAKRDAGRWRLIMMCPLNVQVVWHMCFGKMNDLMIENAYVLPSQQGLKLSSGGWKQFLRLWKYQGLNYAMDMSSWDWTFPGWMFSLIVRLRARLTYGKDQVLWSQVAQRLYREAFYDPQILFSDGSVLTQTAGWGVQKSGCVNTIADNSLAQVLLHLFYCKLTGEHHEPLPVACGDDKLVAQQFCDKSVYDRMGVLVKHCRKEHEFVGFLFEDNGPVPVYKFKHLYKFLWQKEAILEDYLSAMMGMYVHSDEYLMWEGLAYSLGLGHKMRSREYYLAWFDRECGTELQAL